MNFIRSKIRNRFIIAARVLISFFLFIGFYDISKVLASSNQSGVKNLVPLSAIIALESIRSKYDPISESITLTTKDVHVTIFLDRQIIVRGNQVYPFYNCVRIQNGIVLLTPEGVDLLLKILYRRKMAWWYEHASFSLGTGKPSARTLKKYSGRKRTGTYYRGMVRTVIIDPGHGGKDPGGIGYRGLKEKDVVLSIGKMVKEELEARDRGLRVILTRTDDTFISLEKRAEIANKVNGSQSPIFISIHANVSYNRSASGYESYYLSLVPYDESAREVAEKENSVFNYESNNDLKYVDKILNQIVDIEYRRESERLAADIEKNLESSVGKVSNNRGVKSAYFYVLKAAKMPSVLVEVGFVTNPNEAQRLNTNSWQRKIARGISAGIVDFTREFKETNGFTE